MTTAYLFSGSENISRRVCNEVSPAPSKPSKSKKIDFEDACQSPANEDPIDPFTFSLAIPSPFRDYFFPRSFLDIAQQDNDCHFQRFCSPTAG